MGEDLIGDVLKIELLKLFSMALIANIGTLGFKRLVMVLKKMVHETNKIPLTFDLKKSMTGTNVLSCLVISCAIVYAELDVFTWALLSIGAGKVFLCSFVTWYVGLGELIELIPAGLKAMRRKFNAIAPEEKSSVEKTVTPVGPTT